MSPDWRFGLAWVCPRNTRHLLVCTGERPMATPRPTQGTCPHAGWPMGCSWTRKAPTFWWTFWLSVALGRSQPALSPCKQVTEQITAATIHCCRWLSSGQLGLCTLGTADFRLFSHCPLWVHVIAPRLYYWFDGKGNKLKSIKQIKCSSEYSDK